MSEWGTRQHHLDAFPYELSYHRDQQFRLRVGEGKDYAMKKSFSFPNLNIPPQAQPSNNYEAESMSLLFCSTQTHIVWHSLLH